MKYFTILSTIKRDVMTAMEKGVLSTVVQIAQGARFLGHHAQTGMRLRTHRPRLQLVQYM